MNQEVDPSLLISFTVLIVAIGFVVWLYSVRKDKASSSMLFTALELRDRLTLINGIGPTLERKLNKLGITSFRQIADLTPDDIDRINEVLDFKGRIEREGWTAQARKLIQAGSRSAAAPKARGVNRARKSPVIKTRGKKTAKKKGTKASVGKKISKKKARRSSNGEKTRNIKN